MAPSRPARLLLTALAALGVGCVNGVRSGKPAAPVVTAPFAGPVAPPLPVGPPAPPHSAGPAAAPTVWRAEYYTISDG